MTIFIDSNIPMYVAGRDHPNKIASESLLEQVQAGKIAACTNTEVLQEILYRYHHLKRFELADRVYELFVQICPKVLPVTFADTERAKALLKNTFGISVRDAIHAAVMLNNDIRQIATFDRGFDAIQGIHRCSLMNDNSM